MVRGHALLLIVITFWHLYFFAQNNHSTNGSENQIGQVREMRGRRKDRVLLSVLVGTPEIIWADHALGFLGHWQALRPRTRTDGSCIESDAQTVSHGADNYI